MIRSKVSKALGLARSAVLPVVLAVMLVVVFGASPASAHGGYKGLFHLGHNNPIAKVTTLVGNVATGSALVVKNPSGGSALGLEVNAGQAPLTVNATAGKATNLSADRLDGKDSSGFYATGSKVADADKLDGKDSSAFATGDEAEIIADRHVVTSTITDRALLTIPGVGTVRGDCDLSTNTTRLHFVATFNTLATMDRGGTDAEAAVLLHNQRQSTSSNTGVERVVWQTSNEVALSSIITATSAHNPGTSGEHCGYQVFALAAANE